MIASWTTIEGLGLYVTLAVTVAAMIGGTLYGRKLAREGRRPWWRS